MARIGIASFLAATALVSAAPGFAFDHGHPLWTAALERHLKDGRVDYAALKQDPSPLIAYLRSLESVTREEYNAFSPPERLAFWINAYNAYAMKLVVDHYPAESIRKVGRFWESPFKIEFIPLEKIHGERISLDTIEHERLRKELGDARIHAAIVCAARSCPRLASRAYTAATIDAELDAAMRGFLADPGRNRWEAGRRTLQLSSIFKWFRADFEKSKGSLLAYVLAYLPRDAVNEIGKGTEPEIEFLDYDWSLNGR